jgi:cytochrome P450
MTTARLECQGYSIPVSEGVSGSIMAIHHNPELCTEPDRFGPERFLERTYSSFEFLSSGGGHRRCLSGGLSKYEVRIALALTARRKPSQAMPASAARGEPTHA